MPLVACPVCEKPISKHAHTCPLCGEPDPLNHVAKSKFLSLTVWLIVLVGVGYIAWFYLLPMLIEFVRHQ